MPNHSNAPVHEAGPVQACLLLFAGCMSVLGSTLIAPNLPRMQAHFALVPQVEFLVPIALTVPALVIAVLSLFVGALADRIGRKKLLVGGLLVYAVFGMAPIWLDSLHAILVTRGGVGFAEALIMTCCTALIGDYFEGAKRDRYLALNTTFASTSAVLFIAIGGVLGELGWRVPFAVYAVSLPLAAAMLLLLWEPERESKASAADVQAIHAAAGEGFSIRGLLTVCAVTVIGSIFFMTVPVHIGYLLNAVGVTSPGTIGMIAAANQGAVIAGSLLFGSLSRISRKNAGRLAVSALVVSIGFSITGMTASVAGVVAGICIAGLGCGLLLPTLMCWNMGQLPAERRALGTGAWMTAFFLGQFFTPIVVGLASQAGGMQQAIRWMGALLLPCAIALCFYRGSRRSAGQLGSVVP
jgi:MFS family permease